MELNNDISELEDSIGEVLVTITPEMFRQVMLAQRATPFAAMCPVERPMFQEYVLSREFAL